MAVDTRTEPTTGTVNLDARVPDGPVAEKWQIWKDNHELVGPRRRGDHVVAVVGTGLAGASAAATLAGMGYQVKAFCYQDSPRRAHSIAAQGGINATKDYSNDGDSIQRLFVDTLKGGDFRSREANVWRLAELSTAIIDQAVAQGVPFNREYGGLLATRSFGGVLVERTFYCRGQTGQQLLVGAYGALSHQVREGQLEMFSKHEMLDVVVVEGRARGIIARNLVSGAIEQHPADVVVLASGGYSNVYYLSTNAMGCNVTAVWRAHKHGAVFANPCFTQIHPTCLPQTSEHQSKLTLMSESLRNDGRVWVPRQKDDERKPNDIPSEERYYFLEEMYPRYGNLVPRDVAARACKHVCDEGHGVSRSGRAVYMDFQDAIEQRGHKEIESRYGNLFELYEQITGESPWKVPMRIYPAPHYAMGGLWVDYTLQTTIPGLFAIGEANFSDHGANRLGASAMMQCLADGYFVVPHTVTDYLARLEDPHVDPRHPEFARAEGRVRERLDRLMSIDGDTPPSKFHRELGKLMLEVCGISREGEKLERAIGQIQEIREAFWSRVKVGGEPDRINQNLEYAGRVADFLELGELMCRDALVRDESCGCHLRDEHQGDDGEPLRNDEEFAHVAAWEWRGEDREPARHVEPLEFNELKPKKRSYA
jgi:succinate dehydrogenase / fumarate reductase flavoprotein subunit